MPILLPKWLMRRYLLLWKNFRERKFTFEEAKEILEDDDARIIALVLSQLKKFSWMKETISSSEDPRKKIYRLKSYQDVYKEMERNIPIEVAQ